MKTSLVILNTLFLAALNTTMSAVKIQVNWPFLDFVAFNKHEHVQLYVHHGRILSQIVIERGITEDKNIHDLLANCDLEIVLV